LSDLFSAAPARVGLGNALFLADLAVNISDGELRENIKRGKYPELNLKYVNEWRGLRGRN
jgi:hypothetical protein